MALEWIWYFIWYSFLGFLLEVGYARWTGGRRDRKCLLLLPLCPVYGLGACAVLLLPPWVLERPLLLVVAGGAAATGVEYGMALFYERVLRVSFWNYDGLTGSIHGRVCLPFALAWSLLILPLVYLVQDVYKRQDRPSPYPPAPGVRRAPPRPSGTPEGRIGTRPPVLVCSHCSPDWGIPPGSRRWIRAVPDPSPRERRRQI